MKVPFSPPDITDEEIEQVVDTLKSGWITTGPKTKYFENQIADFVNCSRAVCFSSATSAMEMILRLLDIGPKDNVITCAYTYTASASVAVHVGADLKLVDVANGSYFMDYDALDKAIDENTKVIIPVDIAGVPCDYDILNEIVEGKKHIYKASNPIQEAFSRIVILADAAHSFGSSRNNIKCGSLADFTSFSFHAVKNLTVGEGGAATWKSQDFLYDEEIYNKLVMLSLHGQTKDALAKTKAGSWEYDIVTPGYKCNMTDIMASVGIAQLNRYSHILQRRDELLKIYEEGLDEEAVSLIPHRADHYFSNKHLLLARFRDFDERQRNDFIKKLSERDVAANVHYKPLPLLTAYKNMGFSIDDYPNAYMQYRNEVSLPLYSSMTNEQAFYVCECVNNILLNEEK